MNGNNETTDQFTNIPPQQTNRNNIVFNKSLDTEYIENQQHGN